ncbi:C6 transcription factor [Metarhizium album ARSEF 1941]|uniref:C6 transcription factor n=1 Tax=Metarhizium album (strain ARSEF 1941) TaxID=1081103 RepID=A0A0B2WV42_METAS|nr:C6 transcription factor [Metarhizium album ARSEF 1941]KHN97312.1 C6 transcription factor [Metarhizium album ARSEF 1941]
MSGLPPCRRCVEQQLECVLAKSRRGGRRIKGVRNSGIQQPPPKHDRHLGPPWEPRDPASSSPDEDESDYRASRQGSQSRPAQAPADADPARGWPASPQHAGNWRADCPDARSTQENADSRTGSEGLEGHIATTDLLNPSDALDLLAQVADLDPGRQPNASTGQAGRGNGHVGGMHPTVGRSAASYYPPLDDGILTPSDASYLVKKYHDRFHPFFPVAYASIFEEGPISEWAEKEPHLLTAILTVASKDDPTWFRVYDACSRHIESFMSTLIYAGSNSVGSVEALLILAEWAPQRPQENSAIGCGQEDHGAWMLVGLAVRLGYLQRLEQTALLPDDQKPSAEVCRKRVVWAACYMSDRQVSIRLGKGFWSRGPGPALHLRAADFPTLQVQTLGPDNMGLLFQAHLELTQLISNAHDILYSSTSHRKQLYVGGEYVRYIDDFAQLVRKWKLTWANHSFTPPVKASLVLSFEFLRLYINAFAFQANLNRAAARNAEVGPGKAGGPLFSNIAGKPDARFIYESIDAANSLLSILNSFIDPVAGLKCMPLKYCLYVIYAAARLAGAITSEGDRGVGRAIHGTITQLQKTSSNPQSLGRRYATSLRLLWRKSSAKTSTKAAARTDPVAEPPEPPADQPEGQGDSIVPSATSKPTMDMDPLSGFSWRDLDSLGQFIANNTAMNMADGMLAGADFDWEHSSGGLDDLAMRPQFDTMWAGHDIIF